MYGPLSRKLLEESRAEVYRYSEEPFKLSSGGQSHHYFNCRKITLQPARLSLLCRIFRDELIPAAGLPAPEALGGLTMGADPIVLGLSLAYHESGHLARPLIVRKEPKGHGMGRQIEGDREEVRSVMVCDDVITTGGATLRAVEALRAAGLEVKFGICVVDREEGGREALAAQGVELYSVFKRGDFAK